LKAKKSVGPIPIDINSEISDNWKSRIFENLEQKADVSTFGQSQKASKISEWLKKHKAGVITTISSRSRIKSSYMERIIIDKAMQYFNLIKKTKRYSSDIRNLNFDKSIVVNKLVNLKRLYEDHVKNKFPHHVIYRIGLKKPILKTDMQYGNPLEGLFPNSDFLKSPFASKLRIGQAVVKFEPGNTRTLNTRIDGYLNLAFNTNPSKRGEDSFSNDLRAMVGLSNYETDRLKILNAKSQARNLLKIDILHISSSQQEIDAAERFWIYFYKAQDPAYGYNIQFGGKGYTRLGENAISIMKRKDLTYFDIDMVIKESLLRDHWSTGGARQFAKNTLGITRNELDTILTFYYGDIVNEYLPGRDVTFSTIRDIYTGNRIIELMMVGFWEQWEIAEQFGLKTRGEGSGSTTLDRWCRRIFKKSFDQVKKDLLDSIISPKVRKNHMKGKLSLGDIADYIPGMDKEQVRYWLDEMYGHRVHSTTSFRTGYRKTGGLEDLKKLVKRDTAIPLLMLGISDEQILKILGYSDSHIEKNKNEIFRQIFDYDVKEGRLDGTTARLLFSGRYIPPEAWNQFNIKYKSWWEHLEAFLDDFY
ncbi:hypothetical protein LCGC14_2012950, partial [marine sediment metagenome]